MTAGRLRLLIGAAAMLWLIGLGAYPLLESTEGRYASIAWDMAHGGSWIEPTLNGDPLFSKPPLAYWAGAAALEALPDRAWAVRLPATLALLACAFLTRALALIAGYDRRRARWAGLLALLAPLATVQGRMTTGDIFLWTGILLAYTGLLDQAKPRTVRAAILGLGLALGFMAKGHMVLFWVVIPAVAWAAVRGVSWTRPALVVHPVTLLVFLGLAAPWFAAALHRHPELMDYWLRSETADRVMASTHGRTEPWWYFLPQLPLLMLPWLPELGRGLRRGTVEPRWRRLWLVWVLVPLVVFSVAHSKRPNYLLPMVTPLALLAVGGLPERTGRGLAWRTGGWAAVVLAVPFVIGGFHLAPPTRAAMRAVASARVPLAAFHEAPSALVFYHHGAVPSVPRAPFPPGTPAPDDRDALRRVLDEGGLVLTRPEHVPELQDLAGAPLATAGTFGKLVLEKKAAPSS